MARKFKITSMVDEHTRMSLLNIVDRSITADRLIEELEKTFAIWGGPPMVLRMDNGPEFISEALQTFRIGRHLIHSARHAVEQRVHRIVQQPATRRVPEPQLLTQPARSRVVIADFKDDHNHRHRHSALGYQTPAEYAARCTHQHHPVGCEID